MDCSGICQLGSFQTKYIGQKTSEDDYPCQATSIHMLLATVNAYAVEPQDKK